MRMNRRYRPYKKGPLPFRYVMLLAILFFVLSTVISLFFINRSIKPTLIHIAELETERIANHLIQYSVQDFADDQENMKDMVVMNTSENGKVTTIDFNAQATSKAMADLSRHLQKNLEDIEKGNFQKEAKEALKDQTDGHDDIIYNIPLGQASGNALIANLGPKVPVRFSVIGDPHTDVEKNIKPYGINNALIDISVLIEVKVRVIIPFASETIVVKNSVPVSIQAVQGDVPDYYNGSGTNSGAPSIVLPEKKEKKE
ncbi:sporulation protein YunB [Bacillus pumilus]